MRRNDASDNPTEIKLDLNELPDEIGKSESKDLPNELSVPKVTIIPDEISTEDKKYLNGIMEGIQDDHHETKEKPRGIDGVKYYYDDNDNLYRLGNELLPNCEYEMKGYSTVITCITDRK